MAFSCTVHHNSKRKIWESTPSHMTYCHDHPEYKKITQLITKTKNPNNLCMKLEQLAFKIQGCIDFLKSSLQDESKETQAYIYTQIRNDAYCLLYIRSLQKSLFPLTQQ